jgi:hypothetical protein
MKKENITDIFSFFLILLLAYAAVSKLVDFQKFQTQLAVFPLIKYLVTPISWGVPLVETGICTLLVIPRTREIGFRLAFTLLILFTIYLIIMTSVFGKDLPCSCGGVIASLSWGQHILFNIFFSIIALAGAILMKKNRRKLFVQSTQY